MNTLGLWKQRGWGNIGVLIKTWQELCQCNRPKTVDDSEVIPWMRSSA